MTDYKNEWQGKYFTLLDGRKAREFTDADGTVSYEFVSEIPEDQFQPEEKSFLEKTWDGVKDVGSTVASGAKEVADFMLLADVNTLTSSDASLIDRGIAAASIIPVGKVLKLRKVDDILKVDADGVKAKKVGKVEGKGTDKDIQIPSVRNNELNKWFDNLSTDKFEEMWSVPHLRSKIEDRIRRPGGYHEWHLVARTPKFKQWGVSMDDIKEMRTLTKDVEFVNPPGRHGRRGSTKAHNEIWKIIDSAPDYESFVRELNEWDSKRMKNGVLNLPEGLRR
ncbi:hypothetical protein [Oceanobacillus senegalensis]|uniref:hypothetical protein n=1 Tax=Oceanobacillus senegalensis TaxID=1936063 RepID=UPI001FE5C3A2|nr:hypothetical protein [Oceanobacillus senegalensis]